ncbi:hypothetical protein IV203_022671 [Nitzschia inconspicua]|uniref:Uncharacterized protein n=1 Tax=Nitzschia inconspicua TaxID=303405 RepID=A0A9K3KJ77_9STRA|nr:hypothetical protein IV203_022671 [Nitzschia inconspicua]
MDLDTLRIIQHVLTVNTTATRIKHHQHQEQQDTPPPPTTTTKYNTELYQYPNDNSLTSPSNKHNNNNNTNTSTTTTIDIDIDTKLQDSTIWISKLFIIGLHQTPTTTTTTTTTASAAPVQLWLRSDALKRSVHEHIVLQNLSPRSVHEMTVCDSNGDFGTRSGSNANHQLVANQIHQRTNGNPFLVRQLVTTNVQQQQQQQQQQQALSDGIPNHDTTTTNNNNNNNNMSSSLSSSLSLPCQGNNDGTSSNHTFPMTSNVPWTNDNPKNPTNRLGNVDDSNDIVINNDNYNIPNIITERLQQLPQSVQNCLQVCACLGPYFPIHILECIIQQQQQQPPSQQPTTTTDTVLTKSTVFSFTMTDVEIAQRTNWIEETYLQRQHPHHDLHHDHPSVLVFFRFGHDQIYQAAYRLRVDNHQQRQQLHLHIARCIYSTYFIKPSSSSSSSSNVQTDNDHDDTDTTTPSSSSPSPPPPSQTDNDYCCDDHLLSEETIDDTILFLCTDQFNHGKDQINDHDETLLLLVRLNLRAANRCFERIAYAAAESYFTTGISLLERYSTRRNKSNVLHLMVDLYTGLAETLLCLGANHTKLQDLVVDATVATAAAAQATSTIDVDTFRLRYAYLISLRSNNDIERLVDETLILLKELGEEPIDSTVSRTELELKREELVQDFQRLSDENILQLPDMDNQRYLRVLQLLTEVLSQVQFLVPNQYLIQVCQLRAVQIVLRHGICKYAPSCFAFAYQALLDDSNDDWFRTAIRTAELAIVLAKKQARNDDDDWRRHIVVECIYYRHWICPHATNIADSLFWYHWNLHHGRIDAGIHAAEVYMYSHYLSGNELIPLSKNRATCLVLKLIDGTNDDNGNGNEARSDMSSGLTMEVPMPFGCDGGEEENCDEAEVGNPQNELSQCSFFYSLHLYVYREEWEKATDLYHRVVELDDRWVRSSPVWHSHVFFLAVIALQNAKTSPWIQRRKWMRAFEKYFSLIRMWVVDRKAWNLSHKYELLEVLKMTVDQGRRNPSDTLLQAAFDRAILPALRAGMFQDAALSSSFAAVAVQDRDASLRYAALAQHCYSKWGASGVIHHLRSTSTLHREVDVSAYFQHDDHHHRGRSTGGSSASTSISTNNSTGGGGSGSGGNLNQCQVIIRSSQSTEPKISSPKKVSTRSRDRFSLVNFPTMLLDNKKKSRKKTLHK